MASTRNNKDHGLEVVTSEQKLTIVEVGIPCCPLSPQSGNDSELDGWKKYTDTAPCSANVI
jgi:hypothetical protein